jgi:uracil-DNA glycosylase
VDVAKSLADPKIVALRREALAEAHVAPLLAFVEELRRSAPAGVPDFDPMDGGVNAECLFLLEAPGSKAVGSGFISRNNPDETAKNFFHLNAEAGLARQRTVTWNAVPWYIGTGNRIRAAGKADLKAAEAPLRQLLSLLPHLRVVVLVGRKSQRFASVVQSVASGVSVLQCPHPSPLSLNGRKERRSEILSCLAAVAEILGPHWGGEGTQGAVDRGDNGH